MLTPLLLYGLGLPATLAALLQLARPRGNALASVLAAARDLFATRDGRRILAGIAAVLALAAAQCALDPALSARLGYDLTPLARGIEDGFVERVQARLPAPLVAPLAWVYVPGYIALLLLPAVALRADRDRRGVAGHLLGFAANYALALPFYLFVPVREVGWSELSHAQPLLEQVWPGLTGALRGLSALDNCFPSLHVSCATSALWFAHRRGGRGLALVAWGMWTLTCWSVVALGIHWGVDVAAGIPFGVACALVGERAARSVDPGSPDARPLRADDRPPPAPTPPARRARARR